MKISTISNSVRGRLTGCHLALVAVIFVIGWSYWTTGSRLDQLAFDFKNRNETAVSETRRTVAELARPDGGDFSPLAAGVQREMDGLLGDIDASVAPASPAKAREAAARMRAAVVDAQARLLKLAQTPGEKPDPSGIDRVLAGMAEQFELERYRLSVGCDRIDGKLLCRLRDFDHCCGLGRVGPFHHKSIDFGSTVAGRGDCHGYCRGQIRHHDRGRRL